MAALPSRRANFARAVIPLLGIFFAGWHPLFRYPFLERDVFEPVYREMLRVAPYRPAYKR